MIAGFETVSMSFFLHWPPGPFYVLDLVMQIGLYVHADFVWTQLCAMVQNWMDSALRKERMQLVFGFFQTDRVRPKLRTE